MLYKKMYLWLVILAALSTAYAAKTEVDITGAAAFYSADQGNDRTRVDIANLIDNDEGTMSYSTAGFTEEQTIIAFDLNGSNMINQLRFFKTSNDIDGTGTLDHPNLEILISTDTGALNTRTYHRVAGLVNGDQGSELMTAVSFNSDGTIESETSNNTWCTVTFDPVTATAVAFSVVRPLTDDYPYVHYPMTEVQAYFETLVLPPYASDPAPQNGQMDVSVLTGLSWLPGANTDTQTVYFGTDPNVLIELAAGDDSLVSASNAEIETLIGGSLDMFVKYYWRVDSVNTDANEIDGDLWSFTTEPPIVQNPTPADDAKGVSASEVTLQWQGFSTVSSYNVYLGTDPEDLVLQDNVTLQELPLDNLMESTDYFWQVEALDAGDNPITVSDVWSFRTAGLTHHWAMDDEIGSSVMADLISGADGVMPVADANIVFIDDAERGRVIEFQNEAHSGILCADTVPMVGNFTLNAWAKRPSLGGMNIFSFGPGDFNMGFEPLIDPDTGLPYDTLDLWVSTLWMVPGVYDNGPLIGSGIDEWHMFTFTHTDGTTSVYKDGLLQITYASGGWDRAVGLIIGYMGGTDYPYVGRLDDLRVYDKGLTADETAQLYLTETHTAETWVCTDANPLDYDGSCIVGIGDLAILVAEWLDCGRYPLSECTD